MCDRVPSRSQPRPRLRRGTPSPGSFVNSYSTGHPRFASACSIRGCVAHALPNALGPTETWEAARPPRACRLACRARNEKRGALLAALGDVGRQNRADTPVSRQMLSPSVNTDSGSRKTHDDTKLMTHTKQSTYHSRDRQLVNLPGSSLVSSLQNTLGIHRNTQTTSPLPRPEEVVLTVSDGSLDASERTAAE